QGGLNSSLLSSPSQPASGTSMRRIIRFLFPHLPCAFHCREKQNAGGEPNNAFGWRVVHQGPNNDEQSCYDEHGREGIEKNFPGPVLPDRSVDNVVNGRLGSFRHGWHPPRPFTILLFSHRLRGSHP